LSLITILEDPETKNKPNSPSQGNKNVECRVEGGLRSRDSYKYSLPGKPLITVITVVFNGAETLRDTIESVMGQSYDNIEHIIIDGGSSDGTVDILRQYDHVIDYWLSEKDSGIYDAMNKGIAQCSGEYVGMLNSDDMFFDSSALQAIVDRFCIKKVEAVFSCLNIVDKDNLKKTLRKYRVTKLNSALLRIGVMPPHPTFYCKKACYKEGGMYKTDYKIAADFEMLARLLIRQKISWSFLDKVTVTMRSGGVSNGGFMSSIKLNYEIIRACKENSLYSSWFFLALKLPIRMIELIR
jgi:glycosyltransferase involved in cell wall biosynthesis